MTTEKEIYYQSLSVVEEYEYRRFVRGGGGFVSAKEQEVVRGLVQRSALQGGSALDCPAGTGRFLPLLAELGFTVHAADTSPSMLQWCRRYPASSYLEASADHLPLGDATVSLWLMSRFCFHFQDPLCFLREASRVLQPGGVLLFDVYNWTPRQWIPGQQRWLGGRVWVHPERKVRSWADSLDFEVVEKVPLFLLAPYLYSWIPLWMTKTIEGLGERWFPSVRSKAYYLLKKRAVGPAVSSRQTNHPGR